MNRRAFLRQAALAATGLPIGATVLQAKSHFTHNAAFNLSVVTDRPDAVITEIEQILQQHLPAGQTVAFAEHRLAGSHLSDLVWIENGALIDYRTSRTALANRLQHIAQNFGMPRAINHPFVLTFSSGRPAGNPENVSVFRENELLKRLPLHQNLESLRIDGERGRVTVQIQNGAARIVAADCKHKTCMKMGGIRSQGQHLVCIPSRIRLTIDGVPANSIDGTVF